MISWLSKMQENVGRKCPKVLHVFLFVFVSATLNHGTSFYKKLEGSMESTEFV